jgi:hypothetical protein
LEQFHFLGFLNECIRAKQEGIDFITISFYNTYRNNSPGQHDYSRAGTSGCTGNSGGKRRAYKGRKEQEGHELSSRLNRFYRIKSLMGFQS